MITSNTIPEVCNYANSESALKEMPSPEQISAGVMPLDSLPAAWWNCMWNDTNRAVNCTRYTIESIVTEVNNVLSRTGICVCDACTDQLLQAIECIRQTIGQAYVAGAVKASDQISINNDGIMSVNCFGNAASLTTASHVVVPAINELNANYSTALSSVPSTLDTLWSIKAVTNHVTTGSIYGVGNSDCYGHLKISDTYDTDLSDPGLAASQKAVSDVFNYFLNAVGGIKACSNKWHLTTFFPSTPPSTDVSYYLLASDTSGYIHPKAITDIYYDKYAILRFCNNVSLCCCHAYTSFPSYAVATCCVCLQAQTGMMCVWCCQTQKVTSNSKALWRSMCDISGTSGTYGYDTRAYFPQGPLPVLNYRAPLGRFPSSSIGPVMYGTPSTCWTNMLTNAVYNKTGVHMGGVVLNVWRRLVVCATTSCCGGYPSTWEINGHPANFPNTLDTFPHSPADWYVWEPIRPHIHFNVYINPLHVLDVTGACPVPPSAYLGYTTCSDNKEYGGCMSWTANPYIQGQYRQAQCQWFPGYGSLLYMPWQLCTSYECCNCFVNPTKWLECFQAIAAQYRNSDMTLDWGTSCCPSQATYYFGTYNRAPMWNFYIES